MNKLLFLLVSCTMAWSINAEPRKDYKCFIETNKGQTLVRFSWQPSKSVKYMKELVGSELPALPQTDGKPMLVNRVYQCVKQEEAFSTMQGRMLEQSEPIEG